MAGGDNCSRGIFVGGFLGAKYGLDSIPIEWIEKTHEHETLLK